MRKNLNEVLFQKIEIDEKSKDADVLGKVQFCFAIGDEKNKNGRIYPSSVLKTEIERLQKDLVQGQSVWCSPGHPEDKQPYPIINTISHRLTRAWWDGSKKQAMAEAEILNTSTGKNLSVLLRHGRLGVSLRGLGETTNTNEGEIVGSSLKILGVDFVVQPSFDQAICGGIFESLDIARTAEADVDEEIENEFVSAKDIMVPEDYENLQELLFEAVKQQFGIDIRLADFSIFEVVLTRSESEVAVCDYEINEDGNVVFDADSLIPLSENEQVDEQKIEFLDRERALAGAKQIHNENENLRAGELSEMEMKISGAKNYFEKKPKVVLSDIEEKNAKGTCYGLRIFDKKK